MNTNYITTNVRLPVTLHKTLKRRALEENRSLAELIRTTLDTRYMQSAIKNQKTNIMVGNKKIETLADLAKLAQPMGGDLSSNIDEIVYGKNSHRR
jgi:hypothetical protein